MQSENELSVGLSIKYLTGYEGVLFYHEDVSSFTRLSPSQISLNGSHGFLSMTTGIEDFNNFGLSKKGSGLGLDLGLLLRLRREVRHFLPISHLGAPS